MEVQDKQSLFNYLTYDDAINPIKLIFEDIYSDEDGDKENKQKKSKVKDDCGQIINILVEKEQNINSQLSSNISDTKSFYRANGLSSKIIEGSDLSGNTTRDQVFKDWQEKKNNDKQSEEKTPKQQLYEKRGHTQSQCDKQNEFLSQVQVHQKYFNTRVGYGDGKASAPVKTTTKPQSPKFQTTKRSALHALKNKQNEELMQKVETKSNTRKIDPKNFFLSTEQRARSRSQTPQKEEEQEYQFKARPKPEFKPFVIQKSDHKQTEFKEFDLSTESRGRSKEQQLKLKLQNEKKQEELKRNFHAQEIPDYNELSSQFKPKRCPTPQTTLPQEFKLETEKRNGQQGLRKQQQSSSVEKYEFKARKMPDFTKTQQPIISSPKKSTIPVNVLLKSSSRAEQRKMFDEQQELNSRKEDSQQSQFDENSKSNEEQELKEIQQTSAFKAQPIRKYKPIEIQKCQTPLTQPQSPQFKVDERLRSTKKKNLMEQQQKQETSNHIEQQQQYDQLNIIEQQYQQSEISNQIEQQILNIINQQEEIQNDNQQNQYQQQEVLNQIEQQQEESNQIEQKQEQTLY